MEREEEYLENFYFGEGNAGWIGFNVDDVLGLGLE